MGTTEIKKSRALIFVPLLKMNLGAITMYTVEEFSFVNKQTKEPTGKKMDENCLYFPIGGPTNNSYNLISLSYRETIILNKMRTPLFNKNTSTFLPS